MSCQPASAVRIVAVAALGLLALVITPTRAADGPRYGVASWPERGRGNHRALVHVAEPADAVWAHIQWRRRDYRPETKEIRVYDAATGERVMNVVPVNVLREYGDIVFQPATTPGDYEVYYLPYNPGVSNFDDAGTYFAPQDTADPAWRERNGLTEEDLQTGRWRELPRAELLEIQARNDFHRMDPMEVVATEAECEALLAKYPDRSYLLFPEDRRFPIRMTDDLPLKWIQEGPREQFRGQAQPGEYYVFQIGLYAARQAIPGLSIRFQDLRNDAGQAIPAADFTCFNLGGTDWLGRPFAKTLAVEQGHVQPLWIGVQVPRDAEGTYRGVLVIQPQGAAESQVHVELAIAGPTLEDGGVSDLWRLARLKWLNSTLGLDDEVVPPFTPLEVEGNTIRCILRQVRFGENGLPESIVSNGREVLARVMELAVETGAGPLDWHPTGTHLTKVTPATVERETTAAADGLSMVLRAKMECDGCVSFRATLTAQREMELRDVSLNLHIRRDVAQYMMGMSKRGGYRPQAWDWKWDVARADNMVWLGDVDAGVQLKLMGPQEVWAGDHRATGLPDSWHNGGRGGCAIREVGDRVLVRVFTGERTLRTGEELELRFRLLITPLKPIDPEHWNWRYGDVRADGNILHVHHGCWENPYINYPFLTADRLAETVRATKAIRTRETDYGQLTYPAEGNIRPERGALHVWARVNFDPTSGTPGDGRFNQGLFALSFSNEDELGFYWNIDDRGMRTYIRRGPPGRNQYDIVMGSTQAEWRRDQRHVLTLSWGDRLAIFVDGRLQAQAPIKGTLPTSLEGARLVFQGGFGLQAVKISDEPYEEGAPLSPIPDERTLLLDTFDNWDGGAQTSPEKIAGAGGGRIQGVCEATQGEGGTELTFSHRTVQTGPKGVNVYYTVGQLSNYAPELWALRSLGDEVFVTQETQKLKVGEVTFGEVGGGYPWLREHLASGYQVGWRQPLFDGETDAAMITQGLSRWHNYYVEGLAWLMRHTGVDGLYLDGIGYDREIMKRVRKVMWRTDPASRINFHAGNDYDFFDRRVSPANFYMEHFPYLSNLWFGELFDYNRSPDYWLVEISGLPFGITSEMLNYENGGNPYRGMIYGMTGRFHPSAPAMWRLWDEFGIQDAEMIGYWRPDCPVRTGRQDVLATVYRKPGKALIALAHWPDQRPGPVAVAGQATKVPTIDGRIEPEEWDQAARLTNFFVWGGQELADQQTEAYLTHDGQHLYLAFRCAHAGGPLRAEAAARDGTVWEDDAVEFFIQPKPGVEEYYQLVGNSRGVFMDGKGQERAWDGPWVYRASVGDGYWEGEASIPFAALGMPAPQEGMVIGFNVCRDQQTPTRQLSCWSSGSSSFHDVSVFGRVTFSSTQPTTRQVAEAAEARAVRVRLRLDWDALGLDPAQVRLKAPAIAHFQQAAEFAPNDEIPVEPARGWLLVVE